MTAPSQDMQSYLPNSRLNRQLLPVIAAGLITLFTVTVLIVYLSPFAYMVTTALKNRQQITRNTVLPLTQQTYEYQGEELPGYQVTGGQEYPVFMVPMDDRTVELALVKEREPGEAHVFINPDSLNIVEWTGNIGTLQPASQISLFTARFPAPDYGVEASRPYPLYSVETGDGIEEWAQVQSPEHIFKDVADLDGDVIQWKGDLDSLTPAEQISLYKYRGDTDPDNGLQKFTDYPLYRVNETEEEWALIRGSTDVFVNINQPNSGVIEWDGDLATAEVTDGVFKYTGASDRPSGLITNQSYPIYEVPDENGVPQSWALVREGTGTDESLFINTSNDDTLVSAVFSEDTFEPIMELGTLLYQGKFSERIYGLVTLGNYPTYVAPTSDGDEQAVWALLRRGTGTDESVFINTTGVDNTTTADQMEYIRQVVDPEALTPVEEAESVYRHNSANLPSWSVFVGDKLPLYEVPTDDGVKQMGLVFGSRTESYFVDPENPDAGLYEYDAGWFGTLDTIDDVDPQWDNFGEAWDRIEFPRFLFNTLAIAVLGLIGTLISCTLVAYGFARFPIPFKNVIFMVLIATIILPRQVTLVPTFAFFSEIGWTNTWLPLIVPHFFANAYNVFLLRQFIQTIPREMDEAAMIDGAGPFRILRSVIVPQAYPALVAAGLFHFVFAWNDYFEPLIYLLGRPDLQPISVGIQRFNFLYGQEPNFIQATSIMALAFPVLLFFLAQRQFMQGIVITGVDK